MLALQRLQRTVQKSCAPKPRVAAARPRNERLHHRDALGFHRVLPQRGEACDDAEIEGRASGVAFRGGYCWFGRSSWRACWG